jgi:predicted DNA-binding transcriptional regulator YafY
MEPVCERLLLLIATFLKYPGVGSPDNYEADDVTQEDGHHDAIAQVQRRLRELANNLNIELPPGYPAVPTLRKDLNALRKYGILNQQMYRWGYYLGTGAMSIPELQVALNALLTQAKSQGHPQVRSIYASLEKRLRGLNVELNGELFYPVRQHLSRVIVYTDPEEMVAKGKNKDNLYHQIPAIEAAISQGQGIEISRQLSPYDKTRLGMMQIYPLQLLYHDIAWYLLYEYCDNGHFAIGRVNRFANYCQPLQQIRGIAAQRESLKKAYRLIENGWGLKLGDVEEQGLELGGELQLTCVTVRFFHPVATFILEGDRRHPSQKITKINKDETTGELLSIDYTVALPPRSLDEFLLWVHRYMDAARIISPPELAKKHHQAAQKLLDRYERSLS